MSYIINTLAKLYRTPFYCSNIDINADIKEQKQKMSAEICSICKEEENPLKYSVNLYNEMFKEDVEFNSVIYKIPPEVIIVDTDDEFSTERVRGILNKEFGEELVNKCSTPSISRALGINMKKGFHIYFMRDENLTFNQMRMGLTGEITGSMDILGNGGPTSGWVIEHIDSEIPHEGVGLVMNNKLLEKLTGRKERSDSERSADETSSESEELDEKFRNLSVWRKWAELMPNITENRDEWLSVAKFFKKYFPDDGFDIFTIWSEKYEGKKGYNERDDLKMWRSIKEYNGVSVGTMIYMMKTYAKESLNIWFNYVDEKAGIVPQGVALEKENFLVSLSIAKGTTFQIAERMSNEIKKSAVYYRTLKGNGQWYIFNDSLKLWMTGKVKPTTIIARTVRKFFMATIANLSSGKEADEKDTANSIKIYLDVMKKLDTPSATSQFITHLETLNLDLTFKDTLDQTKGKIVYKNGIYDIQTDTFRDGIFYEDRLTFTLPFEYQRAKPEVKERVKKILMEINSQEAWKYEYYIKMLGYSLTGQARDETVCFFLIGLTAGNGKSSVLDCLSNRMTGYVKKMQNDCFEVKNTKKYKQFADVENNRIIWVNEVSQKNEQDVEAIKNYADGVGLKNEVVFGTEADVKVNSKVFFVSNGEPKFASDEGIRRRYRYVEFSSKFFDDEQQMLTFTNGEVNKNKHYIVDSSVPSFLESDDGLSALLEILYEGARLWYKNKLQTPEQYNKLKEQAISSNDVYSEFITKHFKQSNKGTIWKGELETFWDICGFDGELKLKDCIQKMREKGFIYEQNKNKKINKVVKTGCFINIEFIAPIEGDDVEEVD